MVKEEFEKYKESLIKYRNDTTLELRELKKKLRDIAKISSKEEKEINQKINDKIELVLQINDMLNVIRMPNEKDIEIRKAILKNYANLMAEVLPSNSNLLFCGCSNIKQVEYILNNNENILSELGDLRTSLVNAEPGTDTFYPYGAIFVFENNNINSYNNSLRNLKYVITTDENIDKLKNAYCNFGYGINIISHEAFYEICKHKYENNNRNEERVNVL